MTLTKCEADATNRTWSATYAVADGATFYTGERVVPLGAADNTLRFETDTYYFYAVMHQVGDGTCHTAVGLWMWK